MSLIADALNKLKKEQKDSKEKETVLAPPALKNVVSTKKYRDFVEDSSLKDINGKKPNVKGFAALCGAVLVIISIVTVTYINSEKDKLMDASINEENLISSKNNNSNSNIASSTNVESLGVPYNPKASSNNQNITVSEKKDKVIQEESIVKNNEQENIKVQEQAVSENNKFAQENSIEKTPAQEQAVNNQLDEKEQVIQVKQIEKSQPLVKNSQKEVDKSKETYSKVAPDQLFYVPESSYLTDEEFNAIFNSSKKDENNNQNIEGSNKGIETPLQKQDNIEKKNDVSLSNKHEEEKILNTQPVKDVSDRKDIKADLNTKSPPVQNTVENTDAAVNHEKASSNIEKQAPLEEKITNNQTAQISNINQQENNTKEVQEEKALIKQDENISKQAVNEKNENISEVKNTDKSLAKVEEKVVVREDVYQGSGSLDENITDSMIKQNTGTLNKDKGSSIKADVSLDSSPALKIADKSKIELTPSEAAIYNKYITVGNKSKNAGNYTAALEYYQNALEIKRDEAVIATICKIYMELKNPNMAFRSAVESSLTDTNAIKVLVIDMVNGGYMKEAEKMLKYGNTFLDKSPNILFAYGYYYDGKKEYKSAFRYYKEALSLNPNNISNLYYYARSLEYNKNYKEAKKIYNRLLKDSKVNQNIKNQVEKRLNNMAG